jgi:hypothetical protein
MEIRLNAWDMNHIDATIPASRILPQKRPYVNTL